MTLDLKQSKPSKIKAGEAIFHIILEVLQYKRKYATIIVIGTIVNNLLRGVGVMLLVPGIALLESQHSENPVTHAFNSLFHWFNLEVKLTSLLIVILALIVASTLLERYITIKVNQYQTNTKLHVRNKLFNKILNMNWQDFSQYNTSEFMRLIDAEINQFARSANNIFKLAVNSLQTFTYLFIAALISWKITAFMCLVGLIIFVSTHVLNKTILKHAANINNSRSALYQTSLDILNNLKFAKIQGLESLMQEDFRAIAHQESSDSIEVFKITTNTNAIIKIISAAVLVSFVWVGTTLFTLQTSALFTILFIAIRILGFTSLIQRNWQVILSGIPSFHNISEILHRQKSISDLISSEDTNLKETITFHNVSYSHPTNNYTSLKEVNFKIAAHHITAIIGKSGAGKTTLIDLITGIIEPNSGTIKIDGTVLDKKTLPQWGKNIAYLAQDTPLFSGTIRDNFKYSHKYISDEEIWQALKQAHVFDTVQKMSLQLDTLVGQDGAFISGGEKQRIALARAISTKPQLLILDEPTSSQDYINERSIQMTLQQLKHNTTIIVIAHRKEIVQQADSLLLLDDGNITSFGDSINVYHHPDFKHLF